MVDPEVLERIAARRAELDGLEEQLVKQLDQVRDERDELVVAERVLTRMREQVAGERAVGTPTSAQVGGRAVFLVPYRRDSPDEPRRSPPAATSDSPPICARPASVRSPTWASSGLTTAARTPTRR